MPVNQYVEMEFCSVVKLVMMEVKEDVYLIAQDLITISLVLGLLQFVLATKDTYFLNLFVFLYVEME